MAESICTVYNVLSTIMIFGLAYGGITITF